MGQCADNPSRCLNTVRRHGLSRCRASCCHAAGGHCLSRAQTHSLFNVPLHVLELLNQGFSQRNLERLSNMGIYTLGQLIQLPYAGLGKRFGQCLTRYLATAGSTTGPTTGYTTGRALFLRSISSNPFATKKCCYVALCPIWPNNWSIG